jgi:cyclic-di-GMP-binding biofilm dispersal mediator protein
MEHLPHSPVVVIGATGELGRRIAENLRLHTDVALVVRTAEKLPASLADLPVEVADIRDAAALTAALNAHAAATGALAGVINAAGVVAFGAFGTSAPGATDEVIATNALGVIHMLDAAAPLVADGGFIANLSGVAAEMDLLGMGAYCASKAAASAAMRVAGRELRRRRVRTLDIRVGHTETGLAGRPVAGSTPALPKGHGPDEVVARIVAAILGGEADLPPGAFN